MGWFRSQLLDAIPEGSGVGVQEGSGVGVQEGSGVGVQEGSGVGVQEGSGVGVFFKASANTTPVDLLTT